MSSASSSLHYAQRVLACRPESGSRPRTSGSQACSGRVRGAIQSKPGGPRGGHPHHFHPAECAFSSRSEATGRRADKRLRPSLRGGAFHQQGSAPHPLGKCEWSDPGQGGRPAAGAAGFVSLTHCLARKTHALVARTVGHAFARVVIHESKGHFANVELNPVVRHGCCTREPVVGISSSQ